MPLTRGPMREGTTRVDKRAWGLNVEMQKQEQCHCLLQHFSEVCFASSPIMPMASDHEKNMACALTSDFFHICIHPSPRASDTAVPGITCFIVSNHGETTSSILIFAPIKLSPNEIFSLAKSWSLTWSYRYMIRGLVYTVVQSCKHSVSFCFFGVRIRDCIVHTRARKSKYLKVIGDNPVRSWDSRCYGRSRYRNVSPESN